MNKKVLSFIVWTSLLFLTGITAGLVASLLTELISFIQALSFGYKEGSFSQQIALVSPSRRFISVTLAGCLAAFGWYFTFKYAKKIETIKDIVHKKAKVNPLSNFIHGMLQLITVSMGSPLGREGASREVAVSITALWLNYIPLKKDDISLLLACASGAALGAVYNAPLATIIFIIESILLKWSLRNLYAALITSFIAVWTVRLLVGSLVQYQLAPLNWNLSLFVWTIFAGFLLSIIIFGYKSLLLAIPKHQPASFKFIYSTIIAFVIAASISIFFPHILGNGKAGLLYYLHSDFQLSYVSLLLLAKALTVFIIFYAGAYGGRIAPSMMMGEA
nr:chloride channel protein [Streptococcus didelphis]